MAPVQDTDWFSISILTFAAIVFVTAELLPVGIITDISISLHEPVGKVGLMVTSYAWAVAVSAVFITSWLASLERKLLLLGITLLFACTNLLIACSSSLTVIFFARILGAFSHGVFWSIVGPLCVELSQGLARIRTTAMVFGGIAIATVITVPLNILLAQWLGWHIAFAAIALASLSLAVAIGFCFPKLPSEKSGRLRQLINTARHPFLQRLCPTTIFALTGHFCAFTYISLILEKGVGIAHANLSFYLFLFGGAGAIGSIFTSTLADRQLHTISLWAMIGMAVVIMLCACLPVGANIIAALSIIIWGAGIVILTVTLQALILMLPTPVAETASSIYVSMFNIGIGTGALLGGLIVDHMPFKAVAWIGSGALLVGALIFGAATKLNLSKQQEETA